MSVKAAHELENETEKPGSSEDFPALEEKIYKTSSCSNQRGRPKRLPSATPTASATNWSSVKKSWI